MEEHFSLMRFIIEYLCFLFFWLWPLPFAFSPPSLLQSSALVHHSWRICRLNSSPVPSAWWGINHWLLSPLQRACGGHLKEVGDLLKTLRWMFVFLWNTCMFEFTILTKCSYLCLLYQRAIRVRSHSFENLGVPRKNASSTSQKAKVKKKKKRKKKLAVQWKLFE